MSFLLRSICFLFLVSSFLNTFVSSTQNLCHSDQRDVLLELKNEFLLNSRDSLHSKRKSWVNNSDCCSWDGITCDANSGKVIGLDLSNDYIHGPLKSNSSLFRLRYLRDLNLALNDFNNTPIPAEFDKLMGLETLDLSWSTFSGQIPSNLLQLTKLVSLDLSSSGFTMPLSIDESFLHLLAQNLRNLRALDMSLVNISSEIPNEFSNMRSLRSLYLEDCKLFGEFPSSVLLIPSLQSINLDGNPNLRGNLPFFHENNSLLGLRIDNTAFSGTIPDSISNLIHLTYLSLSNSKFSGNIPFSLINLSELSYLDLSSNNFSGEIPPSIGNLNQLNHFDVAGNKLSGNLPASIFNFTQLRYLRLSSNQFSGSIPPIISPLSTLMSGCIITEFPLCPNLISIDLSNNKFKGQVPDWLWRVPLLSNVNLSNNSLSSFNGSFKDSPQSHLTTLDISSNAFQGPLFIPPRSLRFFLGSNNNFSGEIPRSICGLNSLQILDLSNNNLHGSIPRCLETLMSSLSDLILRNNSLSGSLPEIFMNATSLLSLDVSHNRMTGKLPASLTGCSDLQVLNVASNRINDMFPFQLNSLLELQVLVLRSNRFHGTLHNADGVWFGFPQLKIIDVSHNDFFGTLPSDYFRNWTVMSLKSDDDDMEPDYIRSPSLYGSLVYYTSLVLMSKGVSMEMERILTIYTAIDFSGNQLHGPIPNSVGLLKELRILNMSSNAFTGHIPSSLANMTSLESLDLSQNKISGEIPPELGTISSLAWINVSHNQLVGSIPQGTQFQRQNCSSYEGNPGLNGPSLKDVCRDIKAPTPPQPEQLETKEEEEESLSWVAAGLGFAPGVVFGLAMGYIVASYKHEWFMKTFGRSKQQSTRTR